MKKTLLFSLLFIIVGCGNLQDRRGFYTEGKQVNYHSKTNSLYDQNGYDRNGYNRSGYDKFGYDNRGYNRRGYDSSGYNESGTHETLIDILKEACDALIF